MLRPPPTPTLFPYTTLFRSFYGKRLALPCGSALLARPPCAGEPSNPKPGPCPGLLRRLGSLRGGNNDRSAAKKTGPDRSGPDRKSTRLNSSHGYISYAVFCL